MVSYPFPPPTAVAGIIAAITGVSHEAGELAQNANFWKQMKGMQVAIGLRAPLDWMVTAVNLMKYKTPNASMREHSRVKHQYVKKPIYRIYVAGGALYNELKSRLSKGEQVFTPYLGVAYALAEVEYRGEVEDKSLQGESELALESVIPGYNGVEVDILKSKGVHRETMPYAMDKNRRLQETVLVYYPDYSSKREKSPCIYLKEKGDLQISQVGNEKVAWFNAW